MSKDELENFKRTTSEFLARGQQEKRGCSGRKLRYIQSSAFKWSIFRRPIAPKVHYSEGALVQRCIIPKVH